MKTTKWMALVAIACLAVSARPTFGNEVAETFMQALEAGDFEAAHAMLDDEVAEQLTEPLLSKTWEALPAQFGELRDRGPARREAAGGRELAVYRLEFANMALDARIAVDADGRIDGFRLLPAPPAPGPAPAAAEFEGGAEFPVDVDGDLPGLLTLPHGEGAFAAVVLVHGSGPNDRDETIGPNKPFRDYQVTVEDDFARWRQASEGSRRAQLRPYPNLNHLFVAGEGMATPAEYMSRAGNVDEDLLDDVAEFIHARREGQR